MRFKQIEPKEGPWPVPCLVRATVTGTLCLYLGPASDLGGPSKDTFKAINLSGTNAGAFVPDKLISAHKRVYGTLTFD